MEKGVVHAIIAVGITLVVLYGVFFITSLTISGNAVSEVDILLEAQMETLPESFLKGTARLTLDPEKESKVLDVDEEGEYAHIVYPLGWNLDNAYTLDIWLYREQENSGTLLATEKPGEEATSLRMRVDQRLVYKSGDTTIRSTRNIAQRVWTNIHIVQNETNVTMYTNGIESGMGPKSENQQTIQNILLGRQGNEGDPNYFRGRIGDVIVYNRALTPEEILSFSSTTSCIPNWQCSAWSVCAEGKRTRVCNDQSQCGDERSRPAVEEACGTSCIPDWVCTSWEPDFCPESQQQERDCRDQNSCSVLLGKPVEIQSCVIEKSYEWIWITGVIALLGGIILIILIILKVLANRDKAAESPL